MGSVAYDWATSHWDEHPEYPVSDWKSEVINDDTRQGYHEWVVSQLEQAADVDR